MSTDSMTQAVVDTEAKRIADLTNTLRIVQNVINLVMEAKFPGTHAEVIVQSIHWLQAVAKDVEKQIPKPAKPVVPEVVTEQPK